MVEMLGFIGCTVLLLKGAEFLASSAYRNEERRLKLIAIVAAVTCVTASIGFAVWLFIESHHVRVRHTTFESKEFPDDFKSDF